MIHINPKITEAIKENNGLITTRQFIKTGFSKQLLCKYCSEGLLVRVQQGIYKLPGTDHDREYLLQCHSPYIIFSHFSVFPINGIKDSKSYYITMPSNKMLPGSIKELCNVFYINPALHQIGLQRKKTAYGNVIRYYDNERTLCDFVRSGNRTGEDCIYDAISYYLSRDSMDLDRLLCYATKFKVMYDLKNAIMGFAADYYVHLNHDAESKDKIFESNLRKLEGLASVWYSPLFQLG